jgi:hypothetical protein
MARRDSARAPAAGAAGAVAQRQAVAGLMERLSSARRPSRSGRKQRELPDGADAEGARAVNNDEVPVA